MTDILDSKKNITIEETKYKSAVSEGTWQKIGGSINFINNRQYDTHSFLLNGPYQLGVGSVGVDGLYIVPIAMELVAVSFFNRDAGVSGSTTFDVHWLSSPGNDQGSIFSTRPQISSAAPDDSYGVKSLIPEVSDVSGVGITLPVLSKQSFEQGEALRFDLDTAMSAAQNSGLTIYFRPIN